MAPSSSSLLLLVTGGTFDKEYDEISGSLLFKDTHIREVLDQGRCQLPIQIRTLMMIDSLDMTTHDRNLILSSCQQTTSSSIVITHGTDTMAETAHILGNAGLERTIVLTGAMIPYRFGSSDGLFNLGSALAFAQSLPHGCYIAMNGRYFPWNNVRKNKSSGTFEPVTI